MIYLTIILKLSVCKTLTTCLRKNFQILLKDVSWDMIYNVRKFNDMFNNFQSIHVRYFETNFPVSYIDRWLNDNKWITKAIRISRSGKKELHSI